MRPTKVDELLAGKTELRKHFEKRARDPGVSGRKLLAEMIAAGLPVKRSSVATYKARWRTTPRARHGLLSRVCVAVSRLNREGLMKLARQLNVGAGQDEE